MARGNGNARGPAGGDGGRDVSNRGGRGRGRGRSNNIAKGVRVEGRGQQERIVDGNGAPQGEHGGNVARSGRGAQRNANDQQHQGRDNGRGRGRGNPGRFNHNDNLHRKTNSVDGASLASSVNLPIGKNVSDDVLRFWKGLHKKLSGGYASSPFSTSSSDDCKLWKQCWDAAGSGANGKDFPVMSLLQIYLALPDSESTHPQASSVVQVLNLIVAGLSATAGTGNSIKVIDTVVSIVKTRLQTSRSLATIRSEIDAFITAVMMLKKGLVRGVMRLRFDDEESEPLKQLQRDVEGSMFPDYLGKIALIQPETDMEGAHSDLPAWAAWSADPTVGWLMSGSWHQDVPALKETYEGELTEYAETLLRTWTVLTFYWGSAALWPKCKFKTKRNGAEGNCDEPLLFHSGSNHSRTCCEIVSKQGVKQPCDGRAEWACHKHYHQAVCQRCLGKLQDILGGAGPVAAKQPPTGASTDIYNAVVSREEARSVGTVFHLTQVASRKPPFVPPNWRTSYRLQPSALVAVVKLSVSNEPLRRDHTLHWAEVVQSVPPSKPGSGGGRGGPPVHESRIRQEGKMAVRLLGRGDIATFSNSDADLPLSTQVAVIDLRVFVPEVISVLSTFANPQFAEHLKMIPFARRLIGAEESLPLLRMPVGRATIEEYTQDAIFGSEIRCLQMLPDERKQSVFSEIVRLPPVRNLYGTQLEAFANGLRSALHCTQGPPGTGKSYVGVCIILALVIIRKHVRKNGTSVGPILMLSYKNHALEEFLGDVLKFAPELLPGQLIRCGKVELPALQAYSEFNSKDEREAEKELQRCIQLQRSARAASKAWVELSRSQEYRAATAVDAVMRVVQLLVQLSKRWFTEEDEDDASSEHSAKDARLIPSLICAVPLSSDNISDVGAYGDVFPNWVAEVAHWKEVFGQAGFPRQLTALLIRWLSGDRPPPRCTAPECMGYQVKGRKFCRAHLCTAAGCLCQRNESDQAVFCEFHACKFVRRGRCCSMRLAAGDFCSEHSCCTCVALAVAGATGVVAGVEGAPAAVRPVTAPGEACAAHRCAEENCKEAALLPQLYCQAHICLFCVRLPSADGKPATGGDYCCDHECQVDGCNQLRLLSIDDSSYCADHTCRLCSDVVDLTSAETEKSLLCSDHRCAYPDYTCLHEVVEYEDVMMYRCEYHSCFVCHLQGTGPQGRPTTADFPRNVCENHPLCCFPPNGNSAAVVLCGECTVPPSELCDAHAAGALLEPVEELQYTGECHGVTKKGAKCKCKCPDANQFYCAAHMNQAADRAVAQEAPRAVQIDPELVKKRAFEEKLSGAKDETQLAEEAVYTTLVRFDLVHCTHEACLVGGRVPLRADAVEGGWKCPLHSAAPASAVPVPLAPEEQEEALPTDAAPAAPGVQEAMSGFQSKTQLSDAKTAPTTGPKAKEADPSEEDDYDVVIDTEDYSRPDAVGANQLDPDEIDMYFDDDGFNPFLPASGVKASAAASRGGVPVPGADNDADSDDGEFNDNQRRLQEIGALDEAAAGGDVDDAEDSESEDGESADEGDGIEDLDDDEVVEAALHEAESWTWSWPIEQRYEAMSRLVRLMVRRLASLREEWDDIVATARTTKAEAGAATMKKAIVVGATVVGASRRLETLRAAEPFAAVVEEACEVMEPTLISVLAVKSLQKLELVGDHRQLPAFVQQCWYNLEMTMPSIKTSMFERLIGDIQWKKAGQRGGASTAQVHRVPFSVLDEQRRMRSNLADLTRPHYTDVTAITDHPKTGTQKMGDTLTLRAGKDCETQLRDLQKHRELWHKRSSDLIPGMWTNVFFWDLPGNAESRPLAGLSACNEKEAHCVVSIAKWLILCGTPHSSITIITPYKGQKNLIIKFLREAKLLPDAKHGGAHHHHDDTAAPITVSTVDTFQGDENDVILLSLVRCRPGNRFIELLNRFIVAVSRARLGLYVVGSKDAVVKGFREGTNGPSHWVQFTEHLKSSTLTAQDPLDRTPRIGTELPVCCPRHLACNRRITDPNLLPNQANWGQFCAQPCPAKIPCGHRCAIPCHSPTQVPHTVSCLEEVDRPCEAHRLVPLLCGDVKRLKPSEPLAEAFRRFQCEVPVTYLRSCGHSVRLHCFEETKLKNKQATLNPCVENVDDFELPCGHRIVKPTCSARAAYQAAPPQCNVQVQHTRRGCGCVMKMRCFESVRELKNLALVQCDHPKEIRRPRCGHNLTSQCHRVSNLLAQWVRSNTGIAAPFPASPQTKLALQYSDRYGAAENALTALIPDCNVKVDYIARCGHPFRDLLCHQAFAHAENGERTLDMCRGDRLTACVLCATPDLHIPCWSEAESRSLTNVLRLQTLTREGNNFSVEEGEVAGFARQGEISSGIINVWKDLCTAQFTVRRRCGHALVRTCREVLMHLASTRKPREGVFAPCTVIIDRTLLCGHKVRVKCCEKDLPEPKCIERNTQVCVYPCGEHQTTPNSCAELRRLRALAAQGNLSCFFEVQVPLYRCGHTVTVKCCDAAQAKAVIPGGARLPSPQSVVTAKQIYCSPCEIVACGAPVTAQFPCGHKKDDVPCHDAFSWVADEFASAPLCCNKVGVNNPVCQHPLEAFCWTIKELRAWQPWSAGLPKVGSVQIFNAQGQATLQQVVYSNSASPKKPPACITPEMVVCTTNTTYYRSDCGHTQVVRCSDAHWQRLQPCEDQVEQVCPQVECHHKRLVMCHLSKQQLPCQNKIQKLCLTCQVNQVESACSKKDVRCNRQVEAPLCCGHIASWLCGTELDPRSRGADAVNHCLQCVLPRWSRYIDITIPTFNLRAPDCWLPLRDQINRKVDGTVKVVSTQNLVTESQFHIDSRQRIARTVLDTLHNNPRLPVEAPPVVPFMSAEELKGQSYTWVICSVNGPDQAVVDRFNTLAHTEFGLGVQLEILTDTAIQDLFRSKAGADGSNAVRCCVGVVYTRKVLTAEAPFVLGAGAKQQKIAARVVANHRSTGLYDAVQYAPRGQGGERKFITAWETGAAVPLAILTVEQMAECRVCMCPYSIMEGLVCASPKKCNTFTCWECLCRSYEAALKPGAIQGCCNKEGDLLCSEQKCRHPITVQQWSKVTPTPEVLEAQQKLKLQTSIAVAVQKELEIQKRQLEAEYARIEQIKDADEKTAAKLRLKIVNEFLTLRCPRCKAAFVDFSGCFALTCSNQACRCGFCAWCLKDCGADAHGHVPGCSEGNRDVHGTFEGFTEHHRQKRTAAVKALIRSENLSKNALAKLKELISRDLTDLRIPVNDVFPAAAVAPPAHGAPLPPQNQQAQQRGFFGFFGLAPAPPPQQQHQQLYHDAPAYNEYADYDMDDDDDEEYDW